MKVTMKMNRKALFACIVGFVLIIVAVLSNTNTAGSHSAPINSASSPQEDDGQQPSTEYCLLCHSQTDMIWELPSGETLSLMVNPEALANSVHAEELVCADCHVNYHFPHERQTSQTIREYQMERYATCRNCHEDQYLHAQDSVHGAAVRSGRIEAAICIDCHGSHDIQRPADPPQRISFTCGQCHGPILEEYSTSVHGSALLEEGNVDVPVCTDCHGVHDIENPTTSLFRVRSPQLCARCHANEELMSEYDISTNVFTSYLDDFHGAPVALFDQHDPETATNKAVCYDCHGVHDIQSVDNGESIRENLLTACQQCHPDATANFPDAWTGHYEPTLAKNPLLTISNGLYNILIPVVGLGLVFFIGTDVFRRIRPKSGQ